MKAIARTIRITSKKLNLVADLVRNKDVITAMSILQFTPKKAAKILNKLVHSAVANAETNFKQNRNSLFIKEIVITEGATIKRSVSISRGRVHPILKRTAHGTVTLGVKEDTAATLANESTEVKTPKKKTAAKKKASTSKS